MSIRTFAALTALSVVCLPALVNAAVYNFETNAAMDGFTGAGCTSGDICSRKSTDGFGGALSFSGAFGTLSATGSFNDPAKTPPWQTATVVQDKFSDNGATSPWVGLGVYSQITGTGASASYVASDDNITATEALVLTFGSAVTITSVKLRADGHFANFGSPADAPTKSFAYGVGAVGGSQTTMSLRNGQYVYDIADMTGTSFVFYGLPILPGGAKQQYYLSEVTVVPEPEAYGLALAGMGVVAFALRRKRATAG